MQIAAARSQDVKTIKQLAHAPIAIEALKRKRKHILVIRATFRNEHAHRNKFQKPKSLLAPPQHVFPF